MFLDIHAHVFRKPFFQLPGRYPWPRPEDLIPFYDKLGVKRGVIQPLIGPEFYLPESNEDILEAAERYPGRFIPFCNIHPRAALNDPHTPLEDIISQYVAAGCKGVGEVICNMSFFDPYMRNLFRAVNKLKLPLTFHLAHRIGGCYGIFDEPGLPGLDETLYTYPDIKFLGHSQRFWAELGVLDCVGDRMGYPAGKVIEGAVPKLLRKHPNLYGDLSAWSGYTAMSRDEEYAVKFLNEFQDKLLYGIDVCMVPIHDRYTFLAKLLLKFRDEGKISEEVFEKITHKNAEKLLGV